MMKKGGTKRALVLLMTMALLTAGLFAAGQAAAQESRMTYDAALQHFTFQYDAAYTVEWDDEDGATLYTGTPGYIPYVLIYRTYGTGFDLEEQTAKITEDMKATYGDRLIRGGDYQTLAIGDKAVSGAAYSYNLIQDGQTYVINMIVLMETLGDSVIKYTAKYLDKDESAAVTTQALYNAISSLQVSKEDIGSRPEGYKVLRATEAEQNFSTLCSSSYSAVWDKDNGASIYTETEGYIPFVLIYRTYGTDWNVESQIDIITYDMSERYGDMYISGGEYETYTVGGKTVKGTSYKYSIEQGSEVYVINLVVWMDVLEDSIVKYTAKFIDGSGDATYEAMEDALRYFQPDADYYGAD